ncbi:hypothetical protein [Pseudomonas sp. LP_7_YM]|uniref:hypothetical protein n=1 Tax=Pseudomonas sp. LP_7_YM TaxID=2485137 RepID=UPI00105CF749|nr:hypothetical protein [Pseudomonas sp. LP_7_YM]TDV65876.1 hypothetical protein EC915_104156 [Pseudomonas sp. LP_7_YM]
MNNEAFMNHLSTIPSLDSIPPALVSHISQLEAIEPARAAVTGQALIGFVEGMSQQAREDVLDTVTYATLAADKRYDVVTENGEWYKTFRSAMTRALNWTPQDLAYVSRSSRERVLTLDQVGLQLIASSLAAAATGGTAAGALILQIAQDAVQALRGQDEPARLFNSRTEKPGGARFLVGGCNESAEGVIVLAVGAVEVKTSLNVTNVLFANWNSVAVDLNQSADVLVFHQSLYAQRRERVRQALLQSSDAALSEFPI